MHYSPVWGHSRVQATYQRVKQLFYWKSLKVGVEDYVRQCLICQQAKHSNTLPDGLLQPLPIPTGAWQEESMDFIEGLPRVGGPNTILEVVDRFTKYAHFIPVKHPFRAQTIVRTFFDNVVKLYGIPKCIVFYQDKIFTSNFWRELFKLLGTQLLLSLAYHLQTDGQTERVNQCLEMNLRCAVHEDLTKWKSWLSQAEFWYNTTNHTSLGCSPFHALYGYEVWYLNCQSKLSLQ